MNSLRNRIDEAFGSIARIAYRHRIKTLLLIGAVVAALLSQLPNLRADNSNDVFFRKGDPALIEYDAFREQFGRDEIIIVALNPPRVFDLSFLEKLREFHEALEEEVPYLKEITSLVNVRDTRGDGDLLIVEDLLREFPATPQEMAALRERVLNSELYPNLYISRDGRVTTLLVETIPYSPGPADENLEEGFAEDAESPAEPPPLTEAENSEVVAAIKTVAARFAGPDFPVYVTGSSVITGYMRAAISRDVAKFVSLSFVTFAIFLLILFRRFSGAMMPLLVVLLSMLSTVSLMAIFGSPFTTITSILPSFITSVGIGSSVHVLAIFYRRFKQSGDKEDAIVFTYRHSGLPIVMTSVTTAAGLLSFSAAPIAPVAALGIFGAAGVMVILLFTMVMMPALVSLLPLRRDARFAGKSYGHIMDRMLVGVADFSTSHPVGVIIVSGIIVVAAGSGLAFQGFGHNIVKWLPPDLEIRRSIEFVDRELEGAYSIEVVVDTGEENGLYKPAIMNNIVALSRYIEQYRNESGIKLVGKTISVANILQETHRALNENRPEFYAVPQNQQLIAQELLLFENSGSDDLERLVDTQFSMARLSSRVRVLDANQYVQFVDDIRREANRLFGDTAQVTVTGAISLFTRTVQLLLESVAQSYVIAGVIITLLMILMLGSIRIGLLSMIPNIAPIIITLGLMGWLGVKLDMANILLGTVAIGLAVDDTIHFFHNFRSYYGNSRNVAEAIRKTMLSTGRAILFTTLVLVTGFWLFMFSSLSNLINFGFFIGITLITALLADILLAPAMMELIARSRRGRDVLDKWKGKAAA